MVVLVLVLAACGGDAVGPDPAPQEAPPVPEAVAAWINARGVPFDGTSLTLPNNDLEFLRALVGDARIVSLGENTHGTREFFETKARILRFLVEEMGFDAFAIEATWPESNRLNRYVRTGEGDPATLLSGLYFWTWRTESVLEMIEWMRAHNAAGGDVGFYGFDMQYPGMALANVEAFIEVVDPDRLEQVTERLACLAEYANDASGAFPDVRYSEAPASARLGCRAALLEVEELFLEHKDVYEGASDSQAYALALQSLRVAIQYEALVSTNKSRDQSMAENVVWLADYLGPDSRLVLWAHNYHVSDKPGAMGAYLRETYGRDMVIVGFSHAGGEFTAVERRGDSYVGRGTLSLDPPIRGSFEWYMDSNENDRYFLDLRGLSTNSDSTAWLGSPLLTRHIGCCYDPRRPERFWDEVVLPESFDVMIHFRRTSATRVLPYEPPLNF